jgi:hypothetical protein
MSVSDNHISWKTTKIRGEGEGEGLHSHVMTISLSYRRTPGIETVHLSLPGNFVRESTVCYAHVWKIASCSRHKGRFI